MPYKLNGAPLDIASAFVAGEGDNAMLYPPFWLEKSSPEDRDALGITWEDDPPPPPPTVFDVAAERERRLAGGYDYDFGDSRGVHRIGTTKADLEGWKEVTDLASAAMNLSRPNAPIDIVTETGPVQITALEWQSILFAAAAFRQPIWAASFVLQAMTPIPADYQNDEYWT